MDTLTLTLTACAWRLLCDMPSAQGSRDGVGTPPRQAVGTPQIFPRILCAFLRDSGTPIFIAPKPPKKNLQTICAKICGKICTQKSAQKNLHKKSAHKSAHQNQRKNRAKNQCEDSVSLEDESQKKKSAPNLCKAPARKSLGKQFLCEEWKGRPLHTKKVRGGYYWCHSMNFLQRRLALLEIIHMISAGRVIICYRLGFGVCPLLLPSVLMLLGS